MKQLIFTLATLSLFTCCRHKAEAPPAMAYAFEKAADVINGDTVIYRTEELKQALTKELHRNIHGAGNVISEVEITNLKMLNSNNEFTALIARTDDKKTIIAGLLTFKDNVFYFNDATSMVSCSGAVERYLPTVSIENGEPNLMCSDCKDCVKTEFFPY